MSGVTRTTAKRQTGRAAPGTPARTKQRGEAAPDLPLERRLAAIHLRLGAELLARAELEALHTQGLLDSSGLADLAEVLWRTGELARAAEAASAHLAAGGDRPLASVIAAEAAAAAGRPDEARRLAGASGAISTEAVAELFAGMPQRAVWPAGTATAPPEMGRDSDLDPGLRPEKGRQRSALAARGAPPGSGLSEGRGLLARAADDLRGSDPDLVAAGLDRLGLALRLEPTLASEVLEALGRRREPAALLIRGDACRLLGNTLEAEAAFALATAALDRPVRRAGP